VPLTDQAAAALDGLSRRERFVGPDDLVFCSAVGAVLWEGEVRRGFYAALERAGLGHLRERTPPFRFHDLRHTFCTLAAGAAPITDVMAWMGHADLATTQLYAHHVPKHDAAQRPTAAFATTNCVPAGVPD
jgi:integrase